MSINHDAVAIFNVLEGVMETGCCLSESSYDYLAQELAYFEGQISEMGLVRQDTQDGMISFEQACMAVVSAVREEYA